MLFFCAYFLLLLLDVVANSPCCSSFSPQGGREGGREGDLLPSQLTNQTKSNCIQGGHLPVLFEEEPKEEGHSSLPPDLFSSERGCVGEIAEEG